MQAKRILLIILSLDIVESSSVTVCFAGRGLSPTANHLQWAVPVTDPCRCTAVRLGGVISPAVQAISPPLPGGDLLFTEDPKEIWTFSNCTTARFCSSLPGSEKWQFFGRSCYLIVTKGLTYQGAEDYCKITIKDAATQLGTEAHLTSVAHLASIHSAEENAFLRQYYREAVPSGNIALWIGYDRRSSGAIYRWLDGSVESGFADWNPGEPSGGSEMCTVLWYGEHWNDWSCYNAAPFVCMISVY